MGGGFGGDLGGLGGIQVGPAAPVDFAKSTGAAGPTWIHPKPPRSPPEPASHMAAAAKYPRASVDLSPSIAFTVSRRRSAPRPRTLSRKRSSVIAYGHVHPVRATFPFRKINRRCRTYLESSKTGEITPEPGSHMAAADKYPRASVDLF